MRLSCQQLRTRSFQCLLLILVLISSQNASAQKTSKTFKGLITNTNGDPLPGVTVELKGSKISTATDISGAFSIEAKYHSHICPVNAQQWHIAEHQCRYDCLCGFRFIEQTF